MGRIVEMAGFETETVLVHERAGTARNREPLWRCTCKRCGASFVARGHLLRKGLTRSCGCLMRESQAATKGVAVDETGRTYEWLTVVRRIDSTSNGSAVWLCRCECGRFACVTGQRLRNGRAKSCGCRIGRPSEFEVELEEAANG